MFETAASTIHIKYVINSHTNIYSIKMRFTLKPTKHCLKAPTHCQIKADAKTTRVPP